MINNSPPKPTLRYQSERRKVVEMKECVKPDQAISIYTILQSPSTSCFHPIPLLLMPGVVLFLLPALPQQWQCSRYHLGLVLDRDPAVSLGTAKRPR